MRRGIDGRVIEDAAPVAKAGDPQRKFFLAGEGNQWFRRNQQALERLHADALAGRDHVLRNLKTPPKRMLEIGCSNGFRLDAARRAWGTAGYGLDPSAAAIEDGQKRFPGIQLNVGTADHIGHLMTFDCVVYGCCLYLCDRADIPKIVSEGDRVLEPGGTLVVFDFAPAVPATRDYHHLPGLTSFKEDHSLYWIALGYKLVSREDLQEEAAVIVLKKPH
jgi:SAM-dependent methyltransferase